MENKFKSKIYHHLPLMAEMVTMVDKVCRAEITKLEDLQDQYVINNQICSYYRSDPLLPN